MLPSNNIPRNLKYFTFSMSFPSIESCDSFFLTGVKRHAFIFSKFKDNVLCFNQTYILSSSVVKLLAKLAFGKIFYIEIDGGVMSIHNKF